ncbi:MAG TPA: hypothetical protein VFX13_17740 [Gaiellales bacterium]|nr:hypothetical protein [Gaiellales bacterium]
MPLFYVALPGATVYLSVVVSERFHLGVLDTACALAVGGIPALVGGGWIGTRGLPAPRRDRAAMQRAQWIGCAPAIVAFLVWLLIPHRAHPAVMVALSAYLAGFFCMMGVWMFRLRWVLRRDPEAAAAAFAWPMRPDS